jgi:hypothetical protein
MPAGVSWPTYLKFGSLALLSMFAGDTAVRKKIQVLETGLRIGIGSGFNRVSGSGSRRAKMAHKSRKKFYSSSFEVLDGLF